MKDTFFQNILNELYLSEYGLNYKDSINTYEDYNHFFTTKNNLHLHEKIQKK